ncbi:MAG: hypothetical protein ACRCW9_04035 [Cetobacterium sp.]
MKKMRSIVTKILEIEKELKLDYINVVKIKKFDSKLEYVKFNDLKVIVLSDSQKERYNKANKIVCGESENFELVIINTTLNLVSKKNNEYRRIA